MTISTTTNRAEYTGNGVTTAFSFPYYFLADADLVVIETVIATGVETTKTLTTHYTVAGAGNSAGGTVTMLTAPASTVTLAIYRDPTATQAVDLVEGDPLPVETAVEQPFDKLTMIVQRVKELIERALRLPEGDTGFVAADLLLPAKVSRASKYLGFDANGKPIATAGTTSVPVISAFMETVVDDANAAAARATLGCRDGLLYSARRARNTGIESRGVGRQRLCFHRDSLQRIGWYRGARTQHGRRKGADRSDAQTRATLHDGWGRLSLRRRTGRQIGRRRAGGAKHCGDLQGSLPGQAVKFL